MTDIDPSQVNRAQSVPQAPQGQPAMQNVKTPSSYLLWIGLGVGIVLLLLIGGILYARTQFAGSAAAPEKIVRIGLSLDTVKIQRWGEERDIMEQKAAEMNATVTTYSAEGDDEAQISQIENFIAQKMDVIIVVAHNSDAVGPVLTKAQQAGIKVIDYDRLTRNGTPDLYLSFDSFKVGENAAQYVVDAVDKTVKIPNIAVVGGASTDNNGILVHQGSAAVLDPLVKEGKIKIVYDAYTPDWSPSQAYENMKKFLDSGATVDGVVVANDGMANGVIQALAEHHLDGKVPVTGQDGELQAVQHIVQGKQTMTSWKPGKPLALRAIQAAIDFSKGKEPETNGTVNNKTADIKSYLFDPIVVTKDNIDATIIKDGTYTHDQVYGATPRP